MFLLIMESKIEDWNVEDHFNVNVVIVRYYSDRKIRLKFFN